MKRVKITLKLSSAGVMVTELLGKLLGRQLKPADVICLSGGLGAGKTALTRGIGRGWGTPQRVTSPTFTLVNEYSRPQDDSILYHLDCYRLMSADDVETIGLDDILAADGSVIIEWPQVAAEWIPADHLSIEIQTVDENKRVFLLTAHGIRSKAIIDRLSFDEEQLNHANLNQEHADNENRDHSA